MWFRFYGLGQAAWFFARLWKVGRVCMAGRVWGGWETPKWSGVAKMVGRVWMVGCVGWSGESAALVRSLENRGAVG